MCRMTDTGVRWKRTIELPSFGESARFLAVSYDGETRYVRGHPWIDDKAITQWLKPLYAVRVTTRSI